MHMHTHGRQVMVTETSWQTMQPTVSFTYNTFLYLAILLIGTTFSIGKFFGWVKETN